VLWADLPQEQFSLHGTTNEQDCVAQASPSQGTAPALMGVARCYTATTTSNCIDRRGHVEAQDELKCSFSIVDRLASVMAKKALVTTRL
jgi:hypothetical protein